jgi:O-antigen ligase
MRDKALAQVPWVLRLQAVSKALATWLVIVVMAWAPFPLGGAIPWAAGLQEMLIGLCCILWLLGTVGQANYGNGSHKVLAIPFLLCAGVLIWAVLQILTIAPPSWAHPLWRIAADTLEVPVGGTISINPWRTETEILKLASYVAAGWLAFQMATLAEVADRLTICIIVITAAYALYAIILELSGYSQTDLFYAVPVRHTYIAGPFMLHNSFATYCGLGTLIATTKVFSAGSESVITSRGWKQFIFTALQFCLARGALYIISAFLCFAAVVASASRLGFVSTMGGLAALALGACLIKGANSVRRWSAVGISCIVLPIAILIIGQGDTLITRVGMLFSSDAADVVRPVLWSAAWRMIEGSPWIGLGLGTFEDAYPMYATNVFPFVMDKAHSDYLEFAAGVGLPAAIVWWGAFTWFTVRCFQGVRERRRNRSYALVGGAASILIGMHSCADFSLQLPAVALLYAILLGIGVAQSYSSRRKVFS